MDTTITQPLAGSNTPKAQSSSNTEAQNADKLDEQIFIKQLLNNNRKRLQSFPDKQTAEEFIEELFQFLFVGQAQTVDETSKAITVLGNSAIENKREIGLSESLRGIPGVR